MKTKLTLKYSSFFFCNNLQLKKGTQTEIDSDTLTEKDITILNAYIRSGGIESSEGLIPVVLEDVSITEQPFEAPVEKEKEEPKVEEKEEEKTEESPKEELIESKEESPAKKTTRRTTKKTK